MKNQLRGFKWLLNEIDNQQEPFNKNALHTLFQLNKYKKK